MILRIMVFVIASFIKPNLAQSQNCVDLASPQTCYSLFMSRMCRDISQYQFMFSYCKKTCEFCTSSTSHISKFANCEDRRHQCPKWKHFCSHESKYYSFMASNCQKTCLFCSETNCIDLDENCSDFAKLGYCSNEHFFNMEKKCPRSCGVCSNKKYENFVKKDNQDVIKEFFCDFENNECDWINEHFDDTADWKVGIINGETKLNKNLSNNYLYLKTEHESYFGNLLLPWQLVLPDPVQDIGEMCLNFELQMSGGKISIMEIQNPSNKNKNPTPRIIYSLDKVNENVAKEWNKIQVTVNVSSKNNLIIVGTKGPIGTYIAIDNMFFVAGSC
ncbi:uncharacterized protein LOC105846713 [Hydra vulgaris]|uniref:uncharacterized protein LOC105846713 n=1 Tax=Hydra vulgaris TaxID=6087 RepID=UPI001F5E89FB|nr:uncharacterized protein LOC105846713 [Hydra vulgaris]